MWKIGCRQSLPSALAVAVVVCAMALSLPARADLPPGLHIGQSLVWQGIPRVYDVLIPASYDGSADVPLVVDLHGFGRTKEFQRSMSGFATVAEAEAFIVAWPQGVDTTWNAGPICTGLAIDDVGFIRAMVSAIGAENRVDPRRIYATGQSCGGAMTQRLACEAADLFAAAAPFSWPVPLVSCAPSRAMPLLETHSIDDTLILYLGGPWGNDPNNPIVPGARAGFEEWRTRDGCTGSSPDVTENPGPTSVCERYTTCNGGAEVGLCSVHTDPAVLLGHYAYFPLVLDGFNTQQHAWDFISGFTLPVDSDGDGVDDSVDNCPTISNEDQADGGIGPVLFESSADGVGNVCDNCTNVANPRVAADFLTTNPWATLTGGQRDDDHDGYGNTCDADFNNSFSTTAADTAQYKASIGDLKAADVCGTASIRPCAIFDINGTNSSESSASGINAADTARYKVLLGSAPGPGCAACTGTGSIELPCTAGTAGDCN